MRALIVAYGNALRRDDAVAARALELFGDMRDVECRVVGQLTPELAEAVAAAGLVMFVDADLSARTVQITPVAHDAAPPLLGHVMRPADVVACARALFACDAAAYICRVPVADVAEGEGLSAHAARCARMAARAMRRFLDERVALSAS